MKSENKEITAISFEEWWDKHWVDQSSPLAKSIAFSAWIAGRKEMWKLVQDE